MPLSYLYAEAARVNSRLDGPSEVGRGDSRKLYMLQSLLLAQQPFLPFGGAIAHTS